MKMSIVILTYNRIDYTKSCIESIRKYTKSGGHEIIVVDNNSTDGTVEWLKLQGDITKVFNDENLGFSKGCNQGIEVSTGDNILLLNNDTVVTQRWLDNLTACLYSSQKIGAVGAVTNNCFDKNQEIGVVYKSIDEMLQFADNHNKSNPELWEERIKLAGFCMLIKKEVINKVGLLDERFSQGTIEDDDYSFRIRVSGYTLMLCRDTFIHHYGSDAFSYQLVKENEKKFEEKWGFNPQYSTSIRQDIVELMDAPKDRQINVLDVGCGCGGTLLKIKDIYKNAELYGIEINTGCAEIAKTFANMKVGNIENETLDYPCSFFDYVIFGDVLESLIDPWKAVGNIKKYLKPSGSLIASIPNIMHYSILRSLINGNWTYEDSGLLDRTHLRFFTLNEIDEMFKTAWYESRTYIRKLVNMTEEDVKFIKLLNGLAGRDMAWQYEAYQYIIIAKNNETAGNVDDASETPAETGINENNGYIYEKLKLLLRRIENGIKVEESMELLIKLIGSCKVNVNDIVAVIMNDIIEKEKVLNFITLKCCERRLHDYAIEMQKKYYEAGNQV